METLAANSKNTDMLFFLKWDKFKKFWQEIWIPILVKAAKWLTLISLIVLFFLS